MERIVYVNGEYLPESEAKVSVFDRGFLFADAVYEVTAVLEGQLIDSQSHLERLVRSCHELGLSLPVTPAELYRIQQALIEKNQLDEGAVYLQLTRGSDGDRDFTYQEGIEPTLVLFTQVKSLLDAPAAAKGIKVISMQDIRWHRRDIKTTSLLAACMAKQAAHEEGADDVWWVEDGYITEGGSSNAFILTREGQLVTRPLSNDILHGITRKAILKLAAELDLVIEERLYTPEEVCHAQEAFSTSATSFIWPVVEIDGHQIGDGKPGAVTSRLREIYIQLARESAR